MKRIIAGVVVGASCSLTPAQPPAAAPGPDQSALPLDPPLVESKVKYKLELVADHLEIPWGFAFLPDGKRMLFTERPGRVRLIEDGKLNPTAVFTVPDILAQGEKGLMGICLHPDFEKNHWVYLAYGSKEKDIRVVRFVYGPAQKAADGKDPGALTDPTVIIKDMPAKMFHAGCRIRFGPDKKLYITAGETFKKELAPDMTSLGGKILRLNDDGSIPADNPFAGDADKAKGSRPEIWSFGNRNPQGIDWDPATGLLWETEHGPSGENGVIPGGGGDELNIIEKGHNYGWPTIHHDMHKEGMETAIIQWTPAIAPASGCFYRGDLFPQWKGQYFFGALGGLGGEKRPGVVRLKVAGRKVVEQEWLATDVGRIREVASGPDGAIWFSTSNRDGRAIPADADDRIMRMVPEK